MRILEQLARNRAVYLRMRKGSEAGGGPGRVDDMPPFRAAESWTVWAEPPQVEVRQPSPPVLQEAPQPAPLPMAPVQAMPLQAKPALQQQWSDSDAPSYSFRRAPSLPLGEGSISQRGWPPNIPDMQSPQGESGHKADAAMADPEAVVDRLVQRLEAQARLQPQLHGEETGNG